MQTFVSDLQDIGETTLPLFSMLQSGPTRALVTLANRGANTANYVFQQLSSGTWTDMDTLGTDLNNTLSPAQVKSFAVNSAYPQVRMVGNASGGTTLDFSVARWYDRPSGGQLPLISLG